MPRRVINATKPLRSTLKTHLYHRDSVGLARRILAEIGKSTGKALNERDLKLCNDYAQDIFGSSLYAHWLKVYTLVAGVFKEGWIPDNYYGAVVLPVLNGQHGGLERWTPKSRQAS